MRTVNEIPEVVKKQIDRDRAELELLRAENVALRTQLGSPPNPVLAEVARALLLGALASNPLQASQSDGNRVMRTQHGLPEPGASTRNAREHLRRLTLNLLDAVARFDNAAERGWRR